MSKKVVLVGHCGPDSSYLRLVVGKADKSAQIIMADDESELNRAMEDGADLLLINRTLDYGFKEESGVELIRRMKREQPQVKSILVSNYPDAQAAATEAGALPGFGKRELGTPRVPQLIREALEAATVS